MNLDCSYENIDFKPNNASYYRRELKKAQTELADLKAKVGMLCNTLNECLEDSKEVLNDYLQRYGENFKPHRIEAQKKIIADAVQAISATEQDVTRWANGAKADVLEGAAEKYDTSQATLLPSTHEVADSLRGMAKELRGEQI
jgi:hypothetical protein